MDIASTRTRLRRTFAYPDDSATSPAHDSDDDGSALDETEQDDLIASLATQNHTTNSRFRLFLLSLPLISTVPYLLALVSRSDTPNHLPRAAALLALTSLGSTAWLLWTQTPGETGIGALDRWTGGAGAEDTMHGDHGTHVPTPARRRRDSFSVPEAVAPGEAGGMRGPLGRWLPWLNVGLCGVLVLSGLLGVGMSGRKSDDLGQEDGSTSWGHVPLVNLPAVVYAVVLAAKMVMGGVDPEKELSGLKYEYKGA